MRIGLANSLQADQEAKAVRANIHKVLVDVSREDLVSEVWCQVCGVWNHHHGGTREQHEATDDHKMASVHHQ